MAVQAHIGVTVLVATNLCNDALNPPPTTPMSLCCFLYFEHVSPRRQVSVFSFPRSSLWCTSCLLAWANAGDVFLPLKVHIHRSHVTSVDVEVKITSSQCPIVGDQFPVQKYLRNLTISRVLLPRFCRSGEAKPRAVFYESSVFVYAARLLSPRH